MAWKTVLRRRPSDWIPPGPAPPPGEDPDLVPGPEETCDCLSGHWRIFQLRKGHRYSTDDLLTAWYAVDGTAGQAPPLTYLDLGCGVGSVLLMVLWRLPGLAGTGVEAQGQSAALARRSVRLNGIEGRATVEQADLRRWTSTRRYDLITASPPYLSAGEGIRSALPQRGPCRFEDRGGAGDYLRSAAAHLAREGTVAWVHATRYTRQNLAQAAAAGFESLEWRRVYFREGRESLISLFRARRESGAKSGQGADLIIRTRAGTWSEEYRSIRACSGFPPGASEDALRPPDDGSWT